MNPRVSRRTFVSAAVAAGVATKSRAQAESKAKGGDTFDVAIVGSGVFGAWTARHLLGRGLRVALIDEYGPGSSRASSGGETRVIRMGYGSQEIYSRMSWDSLTQWKNLERTTGERLFTETGMLFLARGKDELTTDTLAMVQGRACCTTPATTSTTP